jgi:hypothetical protein
MRRGVSGWRTQDRKEWAAVSRDFWWLESSEPFVSVQVSRSGRRWVGGVLILDVIHLSTSLHIFICTPCFRFSNIISAIRYDLVF